MKEPLAVLKRRSIVSFRIFHFPTSKEINCENKKGGPPPSAGNRKRRTDEVPHPDLAVCVGGGGLGGTHPRPGQEVPHHDLASVPPCPYLNEGVPILTWPGYLPAPHPDLARVPTPWEGTWDLTWLGYPQKGTWDQWKCYGMEMG